MLFTTVALGLAAAIGGLLVLALIRGRAGDAPPAAYDLMVYREQLREVDKDLARGVITADEAERIRTEVSRRVLEADRKLAEQGGGGQAPPRASLATGAVLILVVVGGTYGIYRATGAPGYADQPLQLRVSEAAETRANRMRQSEAEAEFRKILEAREEKGLPPPPIARVPELDPEEVELIEKLRGIVAERQDDLRGFVLLARNEAALGNFKAAYAAQSRVIELKEGQATAEDYATMADLMFLAAGGYVSPEAEAVLEKALNRDPRNGIALYYWGLMHIQTGRPDIAFRVWRELLNNSEAGDPWLAPVRNQMPDLAWYAGDTDYELPPLPEGGGGGDALRGPSAEDMAAAADMTPEQRQQMIETMVANLSDRLAREGGGPDQWAQLIRALGVLGDTEQAGRIWAEAQQVFGEYPDALETVRAAARDAGVSE